MSKVKPHLIDKKEKAELVNGLFEVISGLNRKEDIINFFLALFTPSEIIMASRRIKIAKMLLDGSSYMDIRIKMRVSDQTITKVDQWVHKGDEQYNKWISTAIVAPIKNRESGKAYKTYSEGMLDKYAHHRFLKELLGL